MILATVGWALMLSGLVGIAYWLSLPFKSKPTSLEVWQDLLDSLTRSERQDAEYIQILKKMHERIWGRI